jgi:hypothetical protein
LIVKNKSIEEGKFNESTKYLYRYDAHAETDRWNDKSRQPEKGKRLSQFGYPRDGAKNYSTQEIPWCMQIIKLQILM